MKLEYLKSYLNMGSFTEDDSSGFDIDDLSTDKEDKINDEIINIFVNKYINALFSEKAKEFAYDTSTICDSYIDKFQRSLKYIFACGSERGLHEYLLFVDDYDCNIFQINESCQLREFLKAIILYMFSENASSELTYKYFVDNKVFYFLHYRDIYDSTSVYKNINLYNLITGLYNVDCYKALIDIKKDDDNSAENEHLWNSKGNIFRNTAEDILYFYTKIGKMSETQTNSILKYNDWKKCKCKIQIDLQLSNLNYEHYDTKKQTMTGEIITFHPDALRLDFSNKLEKVYKRLQQYKEYFDFNIILKNKKVPKYTIFNHYTTFMNFNATHNLLNNFSHDIDNYLKILSLMNIDLKELKIEIDDIFVKDKDSEKNLDWFTKNLKMILKQKYPNIIFNLNT